MRNHRRLLITVGATLALATLGAAQFMEVVKILGVGAAVQRFGGEINRSINKLSGHQDSNAVTTKVVPIISGGINSRKAIGAAQVMGPRRDVEKVKAVVQLDQDLFGEIKIRAMIPIESERVVENIRRVEGVGVSGIVDLRL